jgi:hypothetical protein
MSYTQKAIADALAEDDMKGQKQQPQIALGSRLSYPLSNGWRYAKATEADSELDRDEAIARLRGLAGRDDLSPDAKKVLKQGIHTTEAQIVSEWGAGTGFVTALTPAKRAVYRASNNKYFVITCD